MEKKSETKLGDGWAALGLSLFREAKDATVGIRSNASLERKCSTDGQKEVVVVKRVLRDGREACG